jgi:hypothetical protein
MFLMTSMNMYCLWSLHENSTLPLIYSTNTNGTLVRWGMKQ